MKDTVENSENMINLQDASCHIYMKTVRKTPNVISNVNDEIRSDLIRVGVGGIGGVNLVRMGMRNKGIKVLVKYGLIVLGVVCFPWLFTLIFNGKYAGDVYGTSSGDYFVLVDKRKVGLEDFVAQALVRQMDIGADEEALKAQGVIVRTFVYEKMVESKVKEINVNKLELPYISYEEMENIWKEDFTDNYNKLMKVVEATAGKVMMYEGEPIKPFFHNMSCGYTRDGVSVLGEGYEYLVSVQSVGDVESEEYQSSVSISKEEFVKKLRKAKKDISISTNNPLETMQIIRRDKGGYIEELQIGNVKMTGDEFAAVFELNSPNFQVEESDGKIRVITKGIGHGFGLSMYGAGLLAKNGKSYTEILQHYYSEVYLEPLWEE